jgi:UPF0716 protein FxsA
MAVAIVLLVVLPLLEFYVLVQVAHVVGWGFALLGLLVVSVVGGWLVKREGLSVWRRVQDQVRTGESPGREVLDGLLVLVAGVLLLVPGFVTDVIGLLLLVAPVRAATRAGLARRYRRSPRVIVATHGPRIVETRADDVPPEARPPRGQLGA